MRVPGHRFLPALAVLLIAAQAPTANGSAYGVGVEQTLHHLRADLNRALQDTVWPTEGEARRLERVRRGVAVFQNRWDQGRFDHTVQHGLIESLGDRLARNRLTAPDRMALTTDLERLRALRNLNENYR